MNITVDNISETRKSVTVTVPADLIKDEEEKVLKDVAKKVKIPGFRPGKVPASIIKTKYEKELEGELQEKVFKSAFNQVVETIGEDIIYSLVKGEVQGGKLEQDSDATLIFLIDVKPSFELSEYKGLKITSPSLEVTEAEIQKSIDAVLKEYADYVLTEEAANIGDYVKLSYEGSINGQLIADLLPRKTIYGTQKSTWEQAGAQNVPGVAAIIEGIVGMKAGDQKTVTMHFPKDFQIQELADQVAIYEISIEEVRSLVLPELDQNLFIKLKVENMDQLHDNIKKDIIKTKTEQSRHLVRSKIIEQLINGISVAVPESAIKDEENVLIPLYMTRMMNYGLTNAQVEAKRDEIIDTAQKEAPNRAKTHMILHAIAKNENIELNEQDLNMALLFEAYQANMKPQQYAKELQKDRKRVSNLRQNALFNKVLDFLHKESKVEFEGDINDPS